MCDRPRRGGLEAAPRAFGRGSSRSLLATRAGRGAVISEDPGSLCWLGKPGAPDLTQGRPRLVCPNPFLSWSREWTDLV